MHHKQALLPANTKRKLSKEFQDFLIKKIIFAEKFFCFDHYLYGSVETNALVILYYGGL